MTPQNEAQMDEEKAKAYNDNFKDHFLDWEKLEISKDGFSTAWDLQQEKIDKLEKELAQQKFNNAHNLSIDQSVADEIKKLNEIINIQSDAIEFYADIENYKIVETRLDLYPTVIGDCGFVSNLYTGGKLARKAKAEVEKIKEGMKE